PPRGVVGVAHDAELGGQHDLVALALDGAADELLVGVGPIHVGRVEERDAQFDSPVDGDEGFVAVAGAVELAHAHAAEALGGHDETLISERAGGNSHGRWYRYE